MSPSSTTQAPSLPAPQEDEYVVATGPHYASGSFILFEADIDTAWVEALLRRDARTDPWRAGPLPMARRAVQDDPRKRQLLDSASIERRHDSVTRTLGRSRFRWHRYGRWMVWPTGRAGVGPQDVARQRAALVITGLELLTVDPAIAPVSGAAGQQSIAGVVIAHIDLTADPAAVSSGLTSHLLADDMRNGIGHILRHARAELAAQVTQWLNGVAPTGSVNISSLPGADGLEAAPIRLCSATEDRQAAVPIYTVLTGLWHSHDDAAESLGEYRYGERGIAPRPQEGAPVKLPQTLATLEMSKVRSCHANRLAGRAPLSPTGREGNRQAPVLAHNLEDEADDSCVRVEHGNWASAFTPTGAGFAYVPGKAQVLHPQLRNDLSSVYSTVLAVEMLKDHALTGFARASLELAHRLQQIDKEADRDMSLAHAHDDALRLWRSFVAFTTEYWALTDTAPATHQEVVSHFQQAIGRDTDVALARTQANLERLTALLELEESRARAERERHEAKREKSFNSMVGILATVFLPLSVIPPVLEWYYPNDGQSSTLLRWPWFVGLSVLFAAIIHAIWRNMKKH